MKALPPASTPREWRRAKRLLESSGLLSSRPDGRDAWPTDKGGCRPPRPFFDSADRPARHKSMSANGDAALDGADCAQCGQRIVRYARGMWEHADDFEPEWDHVPEPEPEPTATPQVHDAELPFGDEPASGLADLRTYPSRSPDNYLTRRPWGAAIEPVKTEGDVL